MRTCAEAALRQACDSAGVEFIPGTELTAEQDDNELHILGYLMDLENEKFREEIGRFQAAMPAVVANVMGLPSVTIPISISADGLPVGIQLMGRPFEDELLLEL